ncbi:MAG: flagellar biosynthesis protein FlgA, partial [Curvibacter sp.]
MNPLPVRRTQAFRSRLRRLAAVVLPLAALLMGAEVAPLRAQTTLDNDATRLTQQWIDQELARSQATQAMPLRMEVVVGSLDERLRLAPCAKVEPYLPAGQRLWGRTRLGLRCTEGSVRWNVFLPVQVKAFGPGWVLKGNVASGAVLNQGDAMEAEVDWAAENAAIVADPSQWVGQVAARMLLPG